MSRPKRSTERFAHTYLLEQGNTRQFLAEELIARGFPREESYQRLGLLAPAGEDHSEDEQLLITLYRATDANGRQTLMNVARSLAGWPRENPPADR